MKLFYYTTAVPNSYCVGVHNGHGFGSLFAKLFSKVAAKTAAKAAAKVASKVGRKALKIVTTKGPDIAKKAAKEAIEKAAEAGGNFAVEKINSLTKKAIQKTNLPENIIHSVSDTLKQGVKTAGSKATNAANLGVDTLVDKGVAGIKRKGEKLTSEAKKLASRDKRWNTIVQLMNEDE